MKACLKLILPIGAFAQNASEKPDSARVSLRRTQASGEGDVTRQLKSPMPVGGCTDETASNYNPDARYDDGSCGPMNPTHCEKECHKEAQGFNCKKLGTQGSSGNRDCKELDSFCRKYCRLGDKTCQNFVEMKQLHEHSRPHKDKAHDVLALCRLDRWSDDVNYVTNKYWFSSTMSRKYKDMENQRLSGYGKPGLPDVKKFIDECCSIPFWQKCQEGCTWNNATFECVKKGKYSWEKQTPCKCEDSQEDTTCSKMSDQDCQKAAVSSKCPATCGKCNLPDTCASRMEKEKMRAGQQGNDNWDWCTEVNEHSETSKDIDPTKVFLNEYILPGMCGMKESLPFTMPATMMVETQNKCCKKTCKSHSNLIQHHVDAQICVKGLESNIKWGEPDIELTGEPTTYEEADDAFNRKCCRASKCSIWQAVFSKDWEKPHEKYGYTHTQCRLA